MKNILLLIINFWRLGFPSFIWFKLMKKKGDDLKEDYFMNSTGRGYSYKNYMMLLLANKAYRSIFYERARHMSNVPFIWIRISKLFLGPLNTVEFVIDKSIGSGIKIAHNAVVVHADELGNNIVLGPFVVIGKDRSGRPHIGDNVVINSNATVFGNITLEDTIVGEGSVVNKSFSNAIIAGVPARIIKDREYFAN